MVTQRDGLAWGLVRKSKSVPTFDSVFCLRLGPGKLTKLAKFLNG